MSAIVAVSTGTTSSADASPGRFHSTPSLPLSSDATRSDGTREASASKLKQSQLQKPLKENDDDDDTKQASRTLIVSDETSGEARSAPFIDSQKVKDASFVASHSTQQMDSHVQQHQQSFPYPHDLSKVLTEVASTGTCSWLPWHKTDDSDIESRKLQPGHERKANESQWSSYKIRGNYKRLRKSSSVLSSTVRTIGAKRKMNNNTNNRTYYPNARSSTATATETMSVESWIEENFGEELSNQTKTQDVDPASNSTVKTFRSVTKHVKTTGNRGSRKRPLFLVRGQAGGSNSSAAIFSPGSVGSARTSASEYEDTSQYECDSEGTSATSNSEISFEHGRGGVVSSRRTSDAHRSYSKGHGRPSQDRFPGEEASIGPVKGSLDHFPYNSLRQALRVAIDLVLDYFYAHHGGYKLSHVESRIKDHISGKQQKAKDHVSTGSEGRNSHVEVLVKKDRGTKPESIVGDDVDGAAGELYHLDSSEDPELAVFHNRKKRLLDILGEVSSSEFRTNLTEHAPPFTLQRIAEVLVSPLRYYTQAHKLCNCLEKLLLVKSSTTAFGGSTGGNKLQNHQEETELAALSQERSRLRSEFRTSQRRQRRKSGSPVSDDLEITLKLTGGSQNKKEEVLEGLQLKSLTCLNGEDTSVEDDEDENHNPGSLSLDADTSQEMLEAAARASLRSKFDHVGMDAAVINRDALSLADRRAMTNSPPPPSLTQAPNPSIGIPCVNGGLLRQHHHGSSFSPTSPEKDRQLAPTRSPLPLVLSPSGSPPIAPMLATHVDIPMLQLQHATAVSGVSSFQLVGFTASLSCGPTAATLVAAARDMDTESRSSASSDVDSESDASFDDSASDRSDGSDAGQHYEPFTAARAMALNRIQQQHRLQSRMFTSLQTQGGGGGGIGDSFRPPADTEYQSGDSVDSTRAVDSGDSDSSSSDIAD